jgi:hypothetical protein
MIPLPEFCENETAQTGVALVATSAVVTLVPPPGVPITVAVVPPATATPSTKKTPHSTISMSIKKLRPSGNGWMRFDLNVGGFLVRGWKWKVQTGAISPPQRRTSNGNWRPVVKVYAPFLRVLRNLLNSGQASTPRNRLPCTLRIRHLRPLKTGWWVFGFTVRGLTILGCRWEPTLRSIQLPISYRFLVYTIAGRRKRRVVLAPGVHINRLRASLVVEARVLGIPHRP